MGIEILATLTFGQWLQEQRGNRKANSLAEEAGLTAQMWSDLENDRSRRKDGSPTQPTIETCRKIANVLGQPIEVVMRYAGYPVGDVRDGSDGKRDGTFDTFATEEFIDYPALEAFFTGLPPHIQKEQYEHIRCLWLEWRREQQVYGRRSDDEEERRVMVAYRDRAMKIIDRDTQQKNLQADDEKSFDKIG